MLTLSSIISPRSLGSTSHHDANGSHDVHHFQLPAQMHGLANAIHQRRKHTNEQVVPRGPDSDIRETKLAYYIEMEVPGVTDKNDILIQWMSPRTFVVEGTAQRPDVGREAGIASEAVWEQESKTNGIKKDDAATNEEDGGELKNCLDDDDDDDHVLRLLLGERKVGSWHRSFTMPADVDMKAMRAKLEGGLLRLVLPKGDMKDEPKFKIEIE